MFDKVFCFGGGGGSRTRVQTGNPKAFYTLSRRLILLPGPGRRQPNPSPSPWISHTGRDAPVHYPWIDDTPYGKRLKGGTTPRDTRRQAALGPAIKLIFLENYAASA